MKGIWEQEYELLMEAARKHLDPSWEHGEVAVLKTAKGNLYVARIPNYQDAAIREPLENLCVQQMVDAGDTQVIACLATISGAYPEILSWNFRSRLVEADSENLQTLCYLWGGGENVHAKPFSALLPPKKK
jgi:hypothetical protein